MTTLKPAKGLLLVAEPSIIGDVSFNRSVVLLAEYNESGSVGFILNKPLQYKLRDFVPEINSKNGYIIETQPNAGGHTHLTPSNVQNVEAKYFTFSGSYITDE